MRFYLRSVGGVLLEIIWSEATTLSVKKGMFHGKLANEEQTMSNSLKR